MHCCCIYLSLLRYYLVLFFIILQFHTEIHFSDVTAIFQSCYCEDAQQSKGSGNCCSTEDDNEATVFHHSGLVQLLLFFGSVCMIFIWYQTLLLNWVCFDTVLQWEALALLLIGISVNQLRSLPEGATAIGIPLATGAYICTVIFVSFFVSCLY